MGASFGPIPVALEPRIKVAAFAAAGLRYTSPPEVLPANFAPQVKVPVLMINGKDDFGATQAEIQRFFELLGTPPHLKRSVVFEGGHVPEDSKTQFRAVLDWFDTHLGPVK